MLFLTTAGVWLLWMQVRTPPGVTHTQFQMLLDGGQVRRVVVQGRTAIINLREPARPASVSLRLPSSVTVSGGPASAEFEARLPARSVDYQIEAPGKLLRILLTFWPVLLFSSLPPIFLTIFLLWLLRRRTPPDNLSER